MNVYFDTGEAKQPKTFTTGGRGNNQPPGTGLKIRIKANGLSDLPPSFKGPVKLITVGLATLLRERIARRPSLRD